MGCEIPLVDAETYATLTNKRSATELFATYGIDIPREYPTVADARPPFLAKPKNNLGQDGTILRPLFLAGAADVEAFSGHHRESEFFFQEHVQGRSLYLLFHLSRWSEQTVVWSQRNLLQQPDGGSMLFALPADLHESPLAARLIALLREIGFHGLGMIEIIESRDRMLFIEMNPRLWGPAQLTLDQGRPILLAFIGDVLYRDPMRFLDRSPALRARGRTYFWTGGLVDTLASGRRPDWHEPSIPFASLICRGLRDDVYLRRDSWRCFLYELRTATLGRRRDG